jgi:hypothetical protein
MVMTVVAAVFSMTLLQGLGAKRAACVLAPTAFTFAADLLATHEVGRCRLTL